MSHCVSDFGLGIAFRGVVRMGLFEGVQREIERWELVVWSVDRDAGVHLHLVGCCRWVGLS